MPISEMRKCHKHGNTKHTLYEGKNRSRWVCPVCSLEYGRAQYRKAPGKRLEAIKIAGEKCTVCKYNEYPAILHFHHVNREDKCFNLDVSSFYKYNKVTLQKEIDKCILLCPTCHQGVETGQVALNNVQVNHHQQAALAKYNVEQKCTTHAKYSKECKDCIRVVARKSAQKRYKLVLDCHGSRCYLCGFDDYDSGFQFHHTNPADKLFAVGSKRTSFGVQRIIEESKKCVLLCATCHSAVEQGFVHLPESLITSYDINEHLEADRLFILQIPDLLAQQYHQCGKDTNELANGLRCHPDTLMKALYRHNIIEFASRQPKKRNWCPSCNKEINVRNQYCRNCLPPKTVINWPSIDYLTEKIQQTSYTAVARELGVSDNAVRKHILSAEGTLP